MEVFCLSSHADTIDRLPTQLHKGVQQFSRYVIANDTKKMFSSAEANHSLATTKIMLMPEEKKKLELKVQGFT